MTERHYLPAYLDQLLAENQIPATFDTADHLIDVVCDGHTDVERILLAWLILDRLNAQQEVEP